MNKLEFYEALLSTLRRRVEKNEMVEHDGMRGNMAYFCDICRQEDYELIIEKLNTLSTNDYCWEIYLTMYDYVIDLNLSEEEKTGIMCEYQATKVLWRLKELKSFECVFSKDYPEWFFIKEKLDEVKEI